MSPDHVLEDNSSKFHLFPLLTLAESFPSQAHFLCNFQNLISLQLVKFIYRKSGMGNFEISGSNDLFRHENIASWS
jgi:hypothetical protein